MVKIFCINKEQVWVYYKYNKKLKLVGKKLRRFACNISFKHEDNKKKIVDLKCYLSYLEVFYSEEIFHHQKKPREWHEEPNKPTDLALQNLCFGTCSSPEFHSIGLLKPITCLKVTFKEYLDFTVWVRCQQQIPFQAHNLP